MRDWSVVRLMPRRAAAPVGPPTVQNVLALGGLQRGKGLRVQP